MVLEKDYYNENMIEMPIRPPWSSHQSKEQLEAQEQTYFQGWLDDIYKRYPTSDLNHFEHNLQVWRQLWRVCEKSDILVILVDSRHPLFHLPASLYHYVSTTLGKPLVLLMNKIDLISKARLNRWLDYFARKYPRLHVVPFSCIPVAGSVTDETDTEKKKERKNAAGIAPKVPFGAAQLEQVIQATLSTHSTVSNVANVSFRSMHAAMQVDTSKLVSGCGDATERQETDDGDDEATDDALVAAQGEGRIFDLEDDQAETKATDFVTIGFVGHPNAGKSSVINALAGRKLVSVSKTPGHTKHLQTLFLNPSTRLCDCPGLVFPAVGMPKEMQVLSGLFPIAQTRDPYSAVQFLAERVHLEQIYRLFPPGENRENPEYPWSAWDICESLAQKLHFMTRKGTFDTYRAANALLRDALAGVVVLAFDPPRLPSTTHTDEGKERGATIQIDATTLESVKPKGRRFGV